MRIVGGNAEGRADLVQQFIPMRLREPLADSHAGRIEHFHGEVALERLQVLDRVAAPVGMADHDLTALGPDRFDRLVRVQLGIADRLVDVDRDEVVAVAAVRVIGVDLAAGDGQEVRPAFCRNVAHLAVVRQHEEVIAGIPVGSEPVRDREPAIRFGAVAVSVAAEPAPRRLERVHHCHRVSSLIPRRIAR